MDLVQTVRKEGSRGGAGDFKWSDVQSSTHRENYLGHSVMAPTGRWARGRDLTWYAKPDKHGAGTEGDSEANFRKEELRRIKEAEQDAMARALGLPVPDRSNPNQQELGTRKAMPQAVNTDAPEVQSSSHGIGFGRGPAAGQGSNDTNPERIEGNVEQEDKQLQYALKEYRRLHSEQDLHRSRSRSRSRDKPRRHRHKCRDRDRRHRSRSKDRLHRRHISSDRRRDRHHAEGRRRPRTRSPHRRDHDDYDYRDRASRRER
jgi:hypothetical protein